MADNLITDAIEVSHVSKHFKVFLDKGTSLKEKALFRNRRRYEERSVLQDVSFSVAKGEAIGIIGENGCGKSTLLKMLSRIMYPDRGSISINGRVSALIELGAGFHPDMSGRENIYTNAAIFGLTKGEIDARLQSIIDFSELGDYIDNPVRTYSSGMYMRLAFSVAINVDADVLLVDEILAVGDAAFQAKCFNRMREIKASGTTIVIVSHSLGQIEQICDRSIWIHQGVIRAEGAPRDVHPQYLDYMGGRVMAEKEAEGVTESKPKPMATKTAEVQPHPDKNRWGNGAVRFTSIALFDGAGKEGENFATGTPLRICMKYALHGVVQHPAIGIGIFRNDGLQCYGTNTPIDHIQSIELQEQGTVQFEISNLWLLPGEYSLDVAIHSEDGFAYDYYRFAKHFCVYSDNQDVGVARMPHSWELK